MHKINYKDDAHTVRWPAMMQKLEKLTIRRRQNLLIKATSYRSGEGLLNTVYMGGMAHASLRRVLGDTYPGTKSYAELIRSVDEKTLNCGLLTVAHTIDYMLAHPTKKCPCCGQIISASRKTSA